MSDFTECIEKATRALSEFSTEEIKAYVNKTLDRAKQSGLPEKEAIANSKEDVFEEALQEIGSDAQRLNNTVLKFEKAAKKIRDSEHTVRDYVGRGKKNISENVESAQSSATNKLMQALFKDLTEDDVKFLQNNANISQIAKAVDGENMGEQANRLGKAIRDYIDLRNELMILSDALGMEEIQEDRWLRAIHDSSRLINPASLAERTQQFFKAPLKSMRGKTNFNENAPKEWLNFIKSQLNLEETFKKTDAFDKDGNIDEDKVNTILNNIYRNITEGKSDIFTKTGVLKDVKSIQKRRRMFFHWKNFQAWSEYNQMYGAGNLFGALMSDIHGSANKVGMADIFGVMPDQIYEGLKRAQVKKGIDKNTLWYRNTDNMFKWVRGESRIAVNMKFATLASNIRAFGSMARLGGIVFQSLPDMNIAASYAKRFGVSYGNALGNQLKALAEQYTSSELQAFGEMMHLKLRHHMGYMGKFVEAQSLGNVTSKITGKYFQYVGMQAWDNGNRLGIMATIGRQLAKNKAIGFDSLDKNLRNQLKNFNVSKEEWNALRKNISDQFLTLDAVDKVSDDDLKKIRTALGQDESSLINIKNQLYRKVHTLYDVAANNAILTPGAYEQSLMLGATKPGTIVGELMRTMMQFKGFGISFVNRSLMHGWENAGDGPAKKALFLITLLGYMMPLSYLSTVCYNWGRGVSTPNVSDMTIPQLAEMVGAPFGVLAIGLDPNSQNPDLLGDLLLGAPSARLMSSLFSGSAALSEGNLQKAKSNFKKALQYTMPGSTLPFVQPYIKNAMGEKTYTSPGQHIIYGGSS